jgi:hypothetical protein
VRRNLAVRRAFSYTHSPIIYIFLDYYMYVNNKYFLLSPHPKTQLVVENVWERGGLNFFMLYLNNYGSPNFRILTYILFLFCGSISPLSFPHVFLLIAYQIAKYILYSSIILCYIFLSLFRILAYPLQFINLHVHRSWWLFFLRS